MEGGTRPCPLRQDGAGTMRVGVFGQFGLGNLGNNASLEAVLAFLQSSCRPVSVTVVSDHPKRVAEQWNVAAVAIRRGPGGYLRGWRRLASYGWRASDLPRIASIVRQMDLVIVAGTGVLEERGLPVNPWELPYSLWSLATAARITGVPLALVAVGADRAVDPLSRWLLTGAADMASYRSYRDEASRDALRAAGVQTSKDSVFADLAFSLPRPAPSSQVDPDVVVVNAMPYVGARSDASRRNEIHERYTSEMVAVLRGLLDHGCRVMLVKGGAKDEAAARRLIERLGGSSVYGDRLSYEPVDTLRAATDLMRRSSVVIASRYHTVVSALMAGTPVISVSYASKNAALLERLELGQWSVPIETVEAGDVLGRVAALRSWNEDQRHALYADVGVLEDLAHRQLTDLGQVMSLAMGPTSVGDRQR